MTKPVPCKRCGVSLPHASLVCPSCGFLASGSRQPDCEVHGGIPAIACCSVCGKPVCGDCAASVNGAFYCDVKDHRTMKSDWTIAASCPSVFEAEMVARNFEVAGLKTMIFARGDFVSAYWFPKLSTASVFVPAEKVAEAQSVMRFLSLDKDLHN